MSRLTGIVCWLLASSAVPIFASPPEAQQATEQMTQVIYPEVAKSIRNQLAISGLDPAEIEVIGVKASERYAACVVQAFLKDEDPRSQRFVTLLAEGRSEKEIDAEILAMSRDDDPLQFMEALELPMKTCKYAVDQELGLPTNR